MQRCICGEVRAWALLSCIQLTCSASICDLGQSASSEQSGMVMSRLGLESTALLPTHICSAMQRGRIFNNSDSARIMNSVSALGVFESISMRTHPNPQDPSKVSPSNPPASLQAGQISVQKAALVRQNSDLIHGEHAEVTVQDLWDAHGLPNH